MNDGEKRGSSKPWGGRYSSETAPEVDLYTASLPFDRRLYRQDIAGSIAHARMLARQGVIDPGDAASIEQGLVEIQEEIESGEFPWRIELEDVHMNIEARLKEKIGPAGGRLHTARSRNDQVALDMHLYLREEIDALEDDLRALQRAILTRAGEHRETILPGYTHLQRAQPVLLAHHLLAYFFMFQRDRERLADARRRVDMCPLGAAALAGTTFNIDPDSTAGGLGFSRRYSNSMDAVSDRDFIAETLFCCSMLAVHLSRLGEEMVLWSSQEFGFLTMDDSCTTGSSIMPQKKNPVIGELMRGKCGRVVGALTSLLVTLKGLPLAYNTDMQEDKEGTFDALDTVKGSVRMATRVLETSAFNGDRMREAVRQGYLGATDLADYLAVRGMPFRDAHFVAAQAVELAVAQGVGLDQLPLEDLRRLSQLIGPDAYDILTPEAGVRRESPMGTGPGQVLAQMQLAERLLEEPPGQTQWVPIPQGPVCASGLG